MDYSRPGGQGSQRDDRNPPICETPGSGGGTFFGGNAKKPLLPSASGQMKVERNAPRRSLASWEGFRIRIDTTNVSNRKANDASMDSSSLLHWRVEN